MVASKHSQVLGEQGISWSRIALISGVAGLLGGTVALAMVALMLWLCKQPLVVDNAASHGISELRSSRLGGIAVLLGAIAFFSVAKWATGEVNALFSAFVELSKKLPDYTIYAFLIALVGLWDDFVTRFRPAPRLVLVLGISIFALCNNVVPTTSSAYDWLPAGLNNDFVLVTVWTLVVAGFVNAGNMADGANGLLGIIAVSFFSVLFFLGSASFPAVFILALIIFLTFNLATGRIFLGDFGSYGLSAMIAFGSLDLYAGNNVSIWFIASLLAYPCIEMVRVIVVRMVRGGLPHQASDDHLHNFLYGLMRGWGWGRNLANSATGCFLGAFSAALPASLVIFGMVDIGSTFFWGYYFTVYSAIHLFS